VLDVVDEVEAVGLAIFGDVATPCCTVLEIVLVLSFLPWR
jgi:hypothetical protein